MKHTFSVAAALAATFSLSSAQSSSSTPTCGDGSLCPQDSPCCSEYGQCGVGAFCLGGCDPQHSYDLTSCMAAPICQNGDYKLNSLDDVISNTEYLGDSSKGNWVSSGQPVVYQNDAILLTMAPSTVGTLLMSTHYVWYGQISATMTTSQGAGVVTAFIMMSDVKDEIDFEFVGVELETAQSNYYWQGVTDYDNEVNVTVSNTVENTHTYTFDWTPDSLSWAVDGVVGRTLYKNTTWNSTTNSYHFPQTPARIELSLWPAGLAKNGEGTVAWAGGLVDWNSPFMQNGYYYAQVKEVSVQCYDPPPGAITDGDKSYYYISTEGTNNTVVIGNNNTILDSLFADGDNPTFNPTASASGTKSAPTMSSTPLTVPGVAGGGNQGTSGTDEGGASGGGSGSSSGTGSQGGSSGGGFNQGLQSGTSEASKVAAGSAVALIGFFVGALML